MPIIKVSGLDASEKQKQILIYAMKHAVATISELEVTEKQVTPFIYQTTQEHANEVFVIEVHGLFAKPEGKPERTPDVLKKLTRRIYMAVWTFLVGQGINGTKFIEIIVDPRINPEAGEYYAADPRIWTPEQMTA